MKSHVPFAPTIQKIEQPSGLLSRIASERRKRVRRRQAERPFVPLSKVFNRDERAVFETMERREQTRRSHDVCVPSA